MGATAGLLVSSVFGRPVRSHARSQRAPQDNHDNMSWQRLSVLLRQPCTACRFGGGSECLLDLACGRGGDIWKWIDAGIKRVKGVDLSPGEIVEARKR